MEPRRARAGRRHALLIIAAAIAWLLGDPGRVIGWTIASLIIMPIFRHLAERARP
jgi:hypothetical protein